MADLTEEYIAKMEDVLETYEQLYNPAQPVVCLDEKPITLHADVRPPSPAKPGREAGRDNEYERRGTANVFCAAQELARRIGEEEGSSRNAIVPPLVGLQAEHSRIDNASSSGHRYGDRSIYRP
ncbi:MAG TPA: hypothetical protein VNY05_35630 [Candidatus Acidoferrales bacterium]|nr:hypothetical protein [Candidatus Acidoferrales bacterium]